MSDWDHGKKLSVLEYLQGPVLDRLLKEICYCDTDKPKLIKEIKQVAALIAEEAGKQR